MWTIRRAERLRLRRFPTSRPGPESGEMLAFAHIPTGSTTTERFNNDVDESKIALTDTVPTMATVEDDRQPRILS